MPLQATSGAASYDAFGGGVAVEPVYIEQIFSTYLYTGNSSTQTITNGIDLAGEGGMVWTKNRSSTQGNAVFDTARGNTKYLLTQTTDAQQTSADDITSFLSNGYTLGNNATTGNTNYNNYTYASWTFRKQPKFFDVVTFTCTNQSNQSVSHNLGSSPGCVIYKPTNTTGSWYVYHRSLGSSAYLRLNATDASTTTGSPIVTVSSTSVTFTNGILNAGDSYVMYVFAHDAGGFGLTGTDNVVSCGSYTGTGALNNQITLGYEPQLVIVKAASISGESWWMLDNMRGMPVQDYSGAVGLRPNTSDAEASPFGFYPTATGFVPADTGGAINQSGVTYIYIAIRRGPMKVPTSGTSVFAPAFQNSTKPGYTSNFPVDFAMRLYRGGGANMRNGSRLTGANHLESNTTAAEASDTEMTWDYMNGWGNDTGAGTVVVSEMFRRAPGFFDEVCYTGTGSARTLSHNLQAVPELILLKDRNNTTGWAWYYGVTNKWISMPGGSAPFTSSTIWNDTAPTSSVFSVGADSNSNASGTTYVAYLWASLAGISKIGTYVGNGSSQTINCGFTSGARFVMVTNLTDGGRWQVVDTARGINSASDPVIRLDQNVAEITGEDPVDPDSSGFIVNVGGPDYTFVNNSGTTYLYLAIA